MAMMDPERVRAYLQVACAGLGFEIGEIWWTANSSGSSTVAAIEEKPNDGNHGGDPLAVRPEGNGRTPRRRSRIRFLQLYTSKSYDDRRSQLVQPPSEQSGGDGASPKYRRMSSADELGKHVLSPRLVDAVTNTAQVVWANCQRREGLLGRSDMRLQTAVGMPVAMDSDGSMCVVVMFSANNVQSSDEAMEYLQSISRSAASTSIPCLLPAIGGGEPMAISTAGADRDRARQPPGEVLKRHPVEDSAPQGFGEGVTARFVSFEIGDDGDGGGRDSTEVHRTREVTQAPKDCYGIPMLPTVAELVNLDAGNDAGSPDSAERRASSPQEYDAFDEASYGVWSTVMDTTAAVENGCSGGTHVSPLQAHGQLTSPENPARRHSVPENPARRHSDASAGDRSVLMASSLSRNSSSSTVALMARPIMAPQRKERLEEFCSAFLCMSVFDAADVWIPCTGEDYDMLCHVTTLTASTKNEALNYFGRLSADATVKIWSGAVGRAYGSGNPVWSANRNVIIDSDRAVAFEQANIETALAVPIFSSGAVTPACVLCCYSLVHCDSVPFVLKFVQQALRLLWEGLDRVEPHESVGAELWRDVAPADLGEMAADTEMQKAFNKKKRHHGVISSNDLPQKTDVGVSFVTTGDANGKSIIDKEVRDRSSSLSLQLDSLNMPSGESSTPGSPPPPPEMGLGPAPMLPSMVLTSSHVPLQQMKATSSPDRQQQTIWAVQNQVQEAVRSVGDAVPWTVVHHHISTNAEGTKRAHTVSSPTPSSPVGNPQHLQPQPQPHAPLQPQLQPQALPQKQAPEAHAQVQFHPLERPQAPVQPQPQPHAPVQPQPQSPAPVQPQPQLQVPVQPQSPAPVQPHPQLQVPVQPQSPAPVQPHPPQALVQLQPQPHPQVPVHPQPQPQAQMQPLAHEQQEYQHMQSQAQHVQHQPHQSVQIQPQPQVERHQQHPSFATIQPQHCAVQGTSAGIVYSEAGTSVHQQQLAATSSATSNLSAGAQEQAGASHSVSPPPSVNFKEDPKVARANIEAFNALARKQRVPESNGVVHPEPHSPQAVQSWGNGVPPAAPGDRPGEAMARHPGEMMARATLIAPAAPVVAPAPVLLPEPSSSQSNPVAAAAPQHMGALGGMVCLPTGQGVSVAPMQFPGSGKPCRIQGCQDFAVARRPYCLKHSGSRMCERAGCTKCAQGSTRFCIAHGGGRRCTFPGCDKGARDKFFCAAHGGGKRCSFEGCSKSAVGGSNLCTSHGGGRRCEIEGCDKSAQSSTRFCVKHGGGKKCSHSGCDKVARGRTMFCAAHGGGVRCKLEGCNRVAIGKLQLCRAHGGGSARKSAKKLQMSQAPMTNPETGIPNPSVGGIIQ